MTIEHHPVADLFPMLPGDELKDLAADIAERGLLQPIVLDKDGRILDGRNRLAACELAGIEAKYEIYEGEDSDGYALTVNTNRRDLTKGQRAVVAARAQSFKLKEYGAQAKLARVLGVPEARLSQAKTILEFAPDLIESVMAGGSLNEAYQEASKRKKAAAELDAMRSQYPDLAEALAEERMSIAEARQEAERREREQAVAQQEALNRYSDAVDGLTRALSWAKTYEPPDEIPSNCVSTDEFTKRVGGLLEITHNWRSG